MEALATIVLLQMTGSPGFPDAKAVDQYYQTHDPGKPRVILFGSMAALVGFILLVVAPL